MLGGMGTLLAYAVGIDEARELCSGSDATAATLRSLATEAFPTPPPAPHTGLLGKLGPFSRHGVGDPIVRPGIPTGRDLDDVVHGHDIAPARLGAAWALVDLWLGHTSWSSVRLALDPRTLDALDFDLVLAGANAQLGLRRVLNDQLSLPLKSLPGQVTGYVRGTQAVTMASGWRYALPELDERSRPVVGPLADWLGGFEEWQDAAAATGRPEPDLVVLFRQDAPEHDLSERRTAIRR